MYCAIGFHLAFRLPDGKGEGQTVGVLDLTHPS
jgi:hypothetical protein